MNLVFLHGFCETSRIWQDFTRSLPDEWHCFTPDLAGFGENRQELPPKLSLEDLADDIRKQLILRDIDDQPVFIGHSLGGYVALEYLKKYGDMAGLVMFHSTAFPDGKEKRVNRDRSMEFVEKHGISTFLTAFTPALFFDPQHPGVPVLHEITSKTSVNTFLTVTRAMKDRQGYTELLRNERLPVHYIFGEQDSFIDGERERAFIRNLPHVSHSVIPGCGHAGMIENPNACRRSLITFLKKNRYFLFD